MKIKSKYAIQEKFSVKPVTVKDVENIIKNIPNNKASGGEISLHILKQSTISFIIFWDFSIFYQIFLSRQVKQRAIINHKHSIYELPHKLPNDLGYDLRKLGNIRNCLNSIEW